jgi:hypothetical protein
MRGRFSTVLRGNDILFFPLFYHDGSSNTKPPPWQFRSGDHIMAAIASMSMNANIQELVAYLPPTILSSIGPCDMARFGAEAARL